MTFRNIDMNTYARRKHFEYFTSMQYPYVGVTNNVDVTELVDYCKTKKYSFYLLFLHIAALAAENVKELRYRIHNGGIIEYDECPTSHTEMMDNGTYCYCTLKHHMPVCEYMAYAEKEQKKCHTEGSLEEDKDIESMYFISSLPWLNYTAIIQPVACGEESNPRITWGKYEEDYKGRKQLPVTILAHHALVDGIHIAQFYENIALEIEKVISSQQ